MKVGFVSLGCPKNLVDGEVMLGLARDAGHEITADAEGAEAIVVNTCAFIDRAKEESVDAILEMARLKRDGGCKTLVVTGCLAERYGEELRKEIPEIDVVLGTGDVPAIADALAGASAANGAQPLRFFRSGSVGRAQGPAPTYLYDASTPRVLTTPRHYAYVKIAEGCNYTCAFCIIPTLRGEYRSRDEDSIVREAESLAARGVRELLLISQDTTFFGLDKGRRGALASLLRRLNDVDGLAWIRLLYLYPTTITDDVLEAMAVCDKVCKYIDLPLQHASADVLRRMRRPGNREAYDALLARIRRHLPDVTLRTTFIVGFPGETDADVDALEAFVRDTGFDHVGVFTYSHEEGTRASTFDDDVPAAVKRARRDRIMRAQKQIVARRRKQQVGQVLPVIVDGPSPDSDLVVTGRLAGQAPDIDSIVVFSDCDPATLRPGDVVPARITAARGYDLVATPLPA
ncbi:MAG TPA: 30S ribosomal protein S12 methylthiotransferase RimO [Vicinamibacterales bacterium]|jgi:ribosomal protein S12 methylthiotransferase|nr:30S ribosomal protein S12 methylthiotransferase RimO [Vicinamibacterales bacterium]